MNWIFKQISDDLGGLRKELTTLKDSVSTELTALKENTTKELTAVKNEDVLVKARLKRIAELGARNKRASEFNYLIASQLTRYLKKLEEELQRINGDFRSPYPLPSLNKNLATAGETEPNFALPPWPFDEDLSVLPAEEDHF